VTNCNPLTSLANVINTEALEVTSKTAKITWFLLVLRWAMDVIEVIGYITSVAQWSTRRNQIIFAVLDVSLNNGP